MVEPWLECQIRPWLERRVRIAIPALRRDRMQLEEPSIHQLLIDAPRSKPFRPSPPASHGSEFRRHRQISQIQMPATQTVAGIFLFAPHVASRPARLCDGGIVPRRKAIRCAMKRTSLITPVGAEEALAKTFPATENAPRSRLRIYAQIGSWSVRRQHPYHYPDKLLLPFWTKYAVLGGVASLDQFRSST